MPHSSSTSHARRAWAFMFPVRDRFRDKCSNAVAESIFEQARPEETPHSPSDAPWPAFAPMNVASETG
jgi:hypothetical protein